MVFGAKNAVFMFIADFDSNIYVIVGSENSIEVSI